MEEVGEGTAEATEEAAVTTARVAATTTGDLTVAAAAGILAAVHGATMTGRKEAAVVGAEREAALMTETGIPACHLAWLCGCPDTVFSQVAG